MATVVLARSSAREASSKARELGGGSPADRLTDRQRHLITQFEQRFDTVLREVRNFVGVRRANWEALKEILADPDLDWRVRLPRFRSSPLALVVMLGDETMGAHHEPEFLPAVLSLPERLFITQSAGELSRVLNDELPSSLKRGFPTCQQVQEALRDLTGKGKYGDRLKYCLDYFQALRLPTAASPSYAF